MKAFKISLRFIAIVLLIFISTGLLIKEISYKLEIQIDKPLSDVFVVFNDQSELKNWMPEIKSIKIIDQKPGIVGSVYKILVDNDGETVQMKEKILAYIPNKKVTLYFKVEDMLKTDDFSFEERNGKTILSLHVLCKTDSFFLQCLFPYFKGKFVDADQKYLDNFKAYIEK